MELGLFQQQSLSLVMTTELRQAIAILQYPCYELSQFLQEQANENPLIELVEPSNLMSMGKRKTSEKTIGEGEENTLDYLHHTKETMHDYLLDQTMFLPLTKEESSILKFLILNIDDNGYLQVTTEEVMKRFGIDEKAVEHVIGLLHQLEPVGIGARDLRECILLQLEALAMEDELVYRIADNYLDLLAERKLKQIAERLHVSVEMVEEAADFIQTLEPRPGHSVSHQDERLFLYPDITVVEEKGHYQIYLNDQFAPRVHLNEGYTHLLKSEGAAASKYLKEHYQKYQWLLKSLEQRRTTLLKIAEEIVKAQTAFLQKGPQYLEPMTLKDVADRIGMHESTVSRAVKNKVIQTPRGAFELKSFFTTKIEKANGENTSAKVVKLAIAELINQEDKLKPLSDQAIADKLKNERGMNISRRTVAKYREEMNILSSAKRKRYSK
ncbi:RNA polymerase factor sigma-54 [Fictibacillus sp. Mic-4]|uniref:RNA polymerase factor sigma-54 n=1 Tax=Fictibacillus TaxID=1329200 RepID=UPI000425358B|nr:RNA polymerase factor sigma-54 [Fictibacillus gelatini]